MKLILQRLLILGLFIFSFYYTDRVVEILKEKDPLMNEIKSLNQKYAVEAVNAEVEKNTIRSGQKGKEIDTEKTYANMKKYGAYNESLTVLKETTPSISLDNNFNKYVVGGNLHNKNISLLFIIQEDDDINTILRILKQKKIKATFFIDGTYLEKNITILKNNSKQEFELLSYQNSYQESYFKTALSYLESLTGVSPKYCYTEKDQEELLKLCEKLKLHTVKPTLIIEKNLFQTIKKNLENSIMISIKPYSYLEEELPLAIDYIKQKGYKIVSLEQLLSE